MPTFTLLRRPASVISPGVEGTSSSSPSDTATSSRWRSTWFGRSPSTASNSAIATCTESGCATHVPSKPAPASRSLVLAHGRVGPLVRLGVLPARDHRGHAAHRVGTAAVARLHEQLRVGLHEGHRHLHLGAIRQHELRALPEALDRREDVVPAAGVQPGRVVAQLVQDRVHLERRGQGLDQDGRLDRAAVEAELVLGELEGVAPQPRLQMRLELGQVEARAARRARAARARCGRRTARSRRKRPPPARRRRGGGARAGAGRVAAQAGRRSPRRAGTRGRRARCARSSRGRRRSGWPGRRPCWPTWASWRPRSRP